MAFNYTLRQNQGNDSIIKIGTTADIITADIIKLFQKKDDEKEERTTMASSQYDYKDALDMLHHVIVSSSANEAKSLMERINFSIDMLVKMRVAALKQQGATVSDEDVKQMRGDLSKQFLKSNLEAKNQLNTTIGAELANNQKLTAKFKKPGPSDEPPALDDESPKHKF
jgi:hypothetical protein